MSNYSSNHIDICNIIYNNLRKSILDVVVINIALPCLYFAVFSLLFAVSAALLDADDSDVWASSRWHKGCVGWRFPRPGELVRVRAYVDRRYPVRRGIQVRDTGSQKLGTKVRH